MARGTQLLRLVQMVREECGRSSSVGVGVDDLPGIKTKLQRTQELYYEGWDWPHMRQFFDRESAAAGQRYYDPSDDVNFERIEKLVIWWNGHAHDITARKGITFQDYSFYDPENNERSDPIQKWDIRWTGSREQIEFWPLPASNDQQWQIQGIRALRQLVSDTHVADLDDHLLALTVAAELLASKDDKSSQIIAGMASTRLHDLKARPRSAAKRYRMGMGEAPIEPQRVVLRVS